MQQSASSSFAQFLLGFSVFIAVFFVITAAVQKFAGQKDAQQQAAAALSVMLKQK